MNGMPPKKDVKAMLIDVVGLGLDVFRESSYDLERKYGFNPKILVGKGYLESDPEINVLTITKKGLEEIGEKPFVQTESPLYHVLEYLDDRGGKMHEDHLVDTDEKFGINLTGAVCSGHVKFHPKKLIYGLTAKGRLILSLGRESKEG